MGDRHITVMPGAVYNEHVDQQNIFPGLRQVDNHYAQTDMRGAQADCRDVQADAHEAQPGGTDAQAAQSFALLVTQPDKAGLY